MDDKKENKQGVAMPEHTDSSANKSSKAANIKNAAADGVVRMGDHTVNSLRSDMDGGDEQTNEVQNGLNQGIDQVQDKINTARNGYEDIKRIRSKMQNKAQQNAQGGTAANGNAGAIQPEQGAGNELAAAGDAGASDAAAGAQAADGASKAGSGVRTVGHAAKTAGRSILASLKALVTNPVFWIVVAVVLIVIIAIVFAVYKYNEEDNLISKSGRYSTEYSDSDNEEIKNTWMGVYYSKYSEMSLYAQVDTASITDGNKDICPQTDNNTLNNVGGEEGYDACSQLTFADLSGTLLSDIDPNRVYQEGTSDWNKLNVRDIDNKEDYLGISAGALSVFDGALNEGYLNPAQLIKPVATSCGLDFAGVFADEANDTDKDGKVTVKDCKLQNFDAQGKPADLTDTEAEKQLSDLADQMKTAQSAANSTLSEAKKAREAYQSAEEAGKTGDELESLKEAMNQADAAWKDAATKVADLQKQQTELKTKQIAQGNDESLYLSVAQSTKFVDSGDAKTSSNASDLPSADDSDQAGVTATDGKTNGQWDYGLGSLVHYKAIYQPSRINNYHVTSVQYICDGDGTSNGVALGACAGHKFGDTVNESSGSKETIESVYSKGYVPASTLYYRDWHKAAEKFYANVGAAGSVYNSASGGEYEIAGIDRNDWVTEPAVSTGVPQTEVKYVIDKAITMAGVVNFDIDQQWVDEADAEHTQWIYTTTENKNLAPATESAPEVGSNLAGITSYSCTEYLYYQQGSKVREFQPGSKLVWHDDRSYTTYKTVEDGDNGYRVVKEEHTVPGHFETEDGTQIIYQGHVYTRGEEETSTRKVDLSKDQDGSDMVTVRETGLNNQDIYDQMIEGGADNQGDYTWGAVAVGVIGIAKEGKLQTYAVQYTANTPVSSDSTDTSYLKQYLKNYRAFVESKTDGQDTWSCYQTTPTLSKSDLSDWQKASKIRSGTKLEGISYTSTNGHPSTIDENTTVCYADNSAQAVKSLNLNNLTTVQFASMAGRLGYTDKDDTDDEKIETVNNNIQTDIGQAADSKLTKILAKKDFKDQTVADMVTTYSNQYGVDGTLLALLIAQEDDSAEGSTSGNITKAKAGTYEAYQMSTRALTTETSGGSSKSSVHTSLLDNMVAYAKSSFGMLKKLLLGADGDDVQKKGKETITVTSDQLDKGGILKGDSSGKLITIDGVQANLSISSDQITVASAIYQFLSAQGYNENAIAGILGNFQSESAINPGRTEGDVGNGCDNAAALKLAYGRTGLGLGQWTGGRAVKLVQFAESTGKNWYDIDVQLSFLLNEGSADALKNSNNSSPKEASDWWLQNWEKPAGDLSSGGAIAISRSAQAENWYSKIVNGELGTSASDPSSMVNNDDIVKTVDNTNFVWDPTDPMYGTDEDLDGDALIATVDDANKKLDTIDIYPADGDGAQRGAIVATGDGLSRTIPMITGTNEKYAEESISLPDDAVTTVWSKSSNGGYVPMSIKLKDSLYIQTGPYTDTKRNALKEGAYQHLIDNKGTEYGGFTVALGDLTWLCAHTDASKTKVIIHGLPYSGYIPDVQTVANDSSMVSYEKRKTAKMTKISGTALRYLSGPQLSVKVAAMRLQGLQVKYDYNIPMVITAYGMGESFMDATLKVYEQETGVDAETAIASKNDTAWADYRKYVFDHQSELGVTDVPESRTYDYCEQVLSRMTGMTLVYQKIDLTYNKDTSEITQEQQDKSDAEKHTYGVWNTGDLYDSLTNVSAADANTSSAHVARALRHLGKESDADHGKISESQWRDLTSGQVSYPETSAYTEGTDYIQIVPHLGDSDIEDTISKAMRFGTGESANEYDYNGDDILAGKISRMLGSQTARWSSSVDATDILGKFPDGSTVDYMAPTENSMHVVLPFGYYNDTYGARQYNDSVIYQDIDQKQVKVYAPFGGTVLKTGTNSYGNYAVIQVDVAAEYNKRDVQITVGRLSSLNVKKGDKVTTSTVVGLTDGRGVFSIGLQVDSKAESFEDLRISLVRELMKATKNSKSSNAKVLQAVQWAINIASDDSHGYDQGSRYGNPDYDCSSFVSAAFHNNGFPSISLSLTTRTMEAAFVNAGFEKINISDIKSVDDLKKGDILLSNTSAFQHTAIYTGDGKVVEASANEKGGIKGGQPGDQTGQEIWNHDVSFDGYIKTFEMVLRLPGTDGAAVTGEAATTNPLGTQREQGDITRYDYASGTSQCSAVLDAIHASGISTPFGLQCVNVSNWYIVNYFKLPVVNGNGVDIARNLLSAHGGEIVQVKEIAPGVIFSYTGGDSDPTYGHTGFVNAVSSDGQTAYCTEGWGSDHSYHEYIPRNISNFTGSASYMCLVTTRSNAEALGLTIIG